MSGTVFSSARDYEQEEEDEERKAKEAAAAARAVAAQEKMSAAADEDPKSRKSLGSTDIFSSCSVSHVRVSSELSSRSGLPGSSTT